MRTAVYTSANLDYLGKARTLAMSVKRHSPETTVYLLLVDSVPESLRLGIEQQQEPFDYLLTPDDLNIPNLSGWMFQHNVVEACTAVKAAGLVYLLEQREEERVLYLDPDIVVFDDLAHLFSRFDDASLLLTPHCPIAEDNLDWIVRNEISSLAHGTFNLGFLGVAADQEGRRFAKWWRHRLHHFCHDNIPRGLFTDQRWIDLVPGQFEGVVILRDPIYNAATWNITQRKISGSVPDQVLADGNAISFYHFSGVQDPMTRGVKDYPGINNATVVELIEWYLDQCKRNGETDAGGQQWQYGTYDNGELIQNSHRLLYRNDPQLQKRFPNPFAVDSQSFYQWLSGTESNCVDVDEVYGESIQVLRTHAERLFRLERSRPYRLYMQLRRLIPWP